MLLKQVLKAVQEKEGGVRLRELSRELGLDPSVLDGMLEFWVKKGRIKRIEQGYTSCDQPTCPPGCMLCGFRAAGKG